MAERREAEEAERRRAEAAAAPDALVAKPRRRLGMKVGFGLALILLIGAIGTARRPSAPDLAADCVNAAFKLSANAVKQARPLTYTIVGPETKRFVLGLDTRTFVRDAEGWAAVPLPGKEDSYEVAAGVEPTTGCRRTGIFGLPVPLGDHTITLYELRENDVVEVAHQTITVTENDPK
jgi:hypothetical protein